MATVLLVDDDSAVLRLAGTILEQAGFLLIRASNGLEALQLYESYAEHIDLILTDLDMPEMGGLELIARVSSTHPSVRVLLMTGCPPEGDPTLRQYPLLSKPFQPGELLRAVHGVLSRA